MKKTFGLDLAHLREYLNKCDFRNIFKYNRISKLFWGYITRKKIKNCYK